MKSKKPVLFALKPHPLDALLCAKLPAMAGKLSDRRFPDGESYLRIDTPVSGKHCIILLELSNPDDKFLPLVFLSSTLKDLGAASVGLVAPYLSYMRQDRRFIDGEAVTSGIFADLLSQHVDWLVTVDPHLHRYHSLDEIYRIPARVVQGAAIIARWLEEQENCFLVGPDKESMQWVSSIAAQCNKRFIIGEKQRRGDRDVTVQLPDLSDFQSMRAVIIDDVISSGQTILECIKALGNGGITDVVCACVHGVFADKSDKVLLSAGLHSLISTNTIIHETNLLDVSNILIAPIQECLHLQEVDLARGTLKR